MTTHNYPIKATSYILNLLGDELIGSDSLAIFELVKNAYDADAEKVTITFWNLNSPEQKIVIEDDGNGMTMEIIHKVWLTIGTDYKKTVAKISPKFNRVSLGNKGVGRLAVHRLADEILLETKTEDELFGSHLHINWKELVNSGNYIEDLFIEVSTDVITPLPQNKGTRITLSGLKNKNWTKKTLRDLARKIENIKNPFQPIENFEVKIMCNDEKQEWLEGIQTATDILNDSTYYFDFQIRKNDSVDATPDSLAIFTWNYKFRPHGFGDISDNNIFSSSADDQILRIDSKRFADIDEAMRDQLQLFNKDLDGIGPISGRFYVFNQTGELLDKTYGAGRRKAIKEYIKENCGVKVFRDNMRVYNYGEPNDDWLGLDHAKVQKAGDHFSKKVTIGAISIKLNESVNGLLEKTNREGFSENETFFKLQLIVNTAYGFFERTATEDKEKLEFAIRGETKVQRVGLSDTIKELEQKLIEKGIEKEIMPYVKKVEQDYDEMRNVMLNSGMTGLNIGLVFHEIEREIRFINSDVHNLSDTNSIKERLSSLLLLLENFSPILKQNKKVKTSIYSLIEKSVQINKSRFSYHHVDLEFPLTKESKNNFEIIGATNLLISSISNIIDNSLYWVRDKQSIIKDSNYTPSIYIDSCINIFSGPALIIADNGDGFKMSPEIMIQPYRTMKEGGMGLGLYYVNLVMESMGGKLLFPSNNELNIPEKYSGACIALVFPQNRTI